MAQIQHPSVARPSTSTRRTRSKASLGECRPYAHSRRCRRWPVPPKGMSAEQRAPPCAARAKGRSRAHPAVTASITPAKRSAAHNPNGERPAESVVSEHTQALDLGALIQCGTEGEREGGGIYTVVAPTGDRRRRPLEGPRTRILMHSSAFRCIHSHTHSIAVHVRRCIHSCMLTRVCIRMHSYAFLCILMPAAC